MTIDELVASRQLDRVQPARDHALQLIAQARRHVDSAAALAGSDPVGAYQLAYDAARKAATALLADRGLRPTSRGGHVVVAQAIEALGVDGFDRLDAMRRRRNKLEYPTPDDQGATEADARAAVGWADAMTASARRLLEP